MALTNITVLGSDGLRLDSSLVKVVLGKKGLSFNLSPQGLGSLLGATFTVTLPDAKGCFTLQGTTLTAQKGGSERVHIDARVGILLLGSCDFTATVQLSEELIDSKVGMQPEVSGSPTFYEENKSASASSARMMAASPEMEQDEATVPAGSNSEVQGDMVQPSDDVESSTGSRTEMTDKHNVNSTSGERITIKSQPSIGSAIHVSNGEVISIFDDMPIPSSNISVKNGERISLPLVTSLNTSDGERVNLQSEPHFEGGVSVSQGSVTSIKRVFSLSVANGGAVRNIGWRDGGGNTLDREVISAGLNVAISNTLVVNGGDIINSSGSEGNERGMKPVDISVSSGETISVFRGIQEESEDIQSSFGCSVMLTGTAINGIIQDITVPTIITDTSIVVGREFVKGLFSEIPNISLDSSIQLGVRLYSYDNKLLNVLSFTSAYFTLDGELTLYASLDSVNNIIHTVAKPSELQDLVRGKVYNMYVHTVDKAGYPSIVLSRKLRFY
ncbi:hypothetical protein [Pectobacterium phage Wc4-1]|uniref:Uncharacterized protein n=1 Tax=Pectobacterium phage Wc4 TaxID=2652428 RepID=A0A5P8D621_9CAUD|nr:hypothetical protein [Pectobacterium phage Wc4]QFP94017.1 hypothetical protein [Pectobacterium phage Wc4-1]